MLLGRGHRHARERLVDLVQVPVASASCRSSCRATPARATGAIVNHSGSTAALASATIFASTGSRAPPRASPLAITSAAAPSLIDDAFAAVTVPSLRERRPQAARTSTGRRAPAPRPGRRRRSPFFAAISHGTISPLNLPLACAGARAPVGLGRERVLVLAGEAVLRRDHVAAVAHVHVLVRVPQAVVDHRVDDLAVAHAVAAARLGQHVGRVGHALHAARDDHARRRRPGCRGART